MALDYKTYAEAKDKFSWSQRWDLFDGNRDRFNVAHECLDRHDKKEVGLRIKFPDRRSEIYTFGELQRLSSQFAHHLERLGVGFGDRVAVLLHPSIEFYTSLYGVCRRGAVLVPLSPLFGPEGIDFRLADAQAAAVVTTYEQARTIGSEVIEKLRPKLIYAEDLLSNLKREADQYEPKTSGRDLCAIQYSSGTTGAPKPIKYAHDTISVSAVIMKIAMGLRSSDTYFCPASPSWGHGIWYGTMVPMVFGKAAGVLSGKYDPELCLEALEEFGVTNMTGIASHYRLMIQTGKASKYNLKLRMISFAGEAMSKDVIQRITDEWGIVPHTQYGSTEAGPITVDYGGFEDWVVKPGSLGKPMIGRPEPCLLDDEGNELPHGRIGQVAVPRGDQWVRVGDLAYRDEDGYFWYVGRADDVIISSGNTIGPLDVEGTLAKHPAVAECAVVGSPDKDRGTVVKAFVKLSAGYEASDGLKRDIQDFVKDKLAKYEYPREVEFIDELPKTPDGKVKRKVLRNLEEARRSEI
ncbi:MAG: acetate--CoA ligase [Chloroflexota bacterium]|nr:MAG: acetate--CoA ligase [Chloroflexota bacterium]